MWNKSIYASPEFAGQAPQANLAQILAIVQAIPYSMRFVVHTVYVLHLLLAKSLAHLLINAGF